MKITINPTLDMETLQFVSNDGQYEYNGPLSLFDRAAQAQAKQQEQTDTGIAANAGVNASQDRAMILPTLKRDINHPTGYTGNQINQNLTAAEQGAGGATGSLAGQGILNAARTRNTAGLSGTLDDAARAKAMAASKAAGGITAESNRLAEAKRASALRGGEGLYGVDTTAQLKGMGMSTDATNAMVNAGKSGWFQNMTDFMKAASDDAKGVAALEGA